MKQRAALTGFTLRDAEILRPAVSAPFLIQTTEWKLFLLKTGHFQNSLGPAFHTVSTGTLFKPTLSQHTNIGQQKLH